MVAAREAAGAKDAVTSDEKTFGAPVYALPSLHGPMARDVIPDHPMDARAAYQVLQDILDLNGRPGLNLASFVTTYCEPEAAQIMAETANLNAIDLDEYPAINAIENRCVHILANLFNGPTSSADAASCVGVSTIGSSEAIILATLAMKRRWKNLREAAGQDATKPNFVMGANVQVAWEKCLRYLEIEPRLVYCSSDQLCMDVAKAADLVDENTVGVCAILGSTYTGEYEDVQGLNDLLEARRRKDASITAMIHVDAASGGFVAPFVAPDLVWDFRLPLVASINVSSHKYGFCLPGIGWALWRSHDFLPKELVFSVDYLGSPQMTFTLNFSKSSSPICMAYYVLIRYGRAGYRRVMEGLYKTATMLTQAIASMGLFRTLSKIDPHEGLPLVSFALANPKDHAWDEFDLAHQLRQRGGILPAYHMAPHAEGQKLVRVVLRQDFSYNRGELFLADLKHAVDALNEMDTAHLEHQRRHAKAMQAWSSVLRRGSHVSKGKSHSDVGGVIDHKGNLGVC
ncbi:glutamate decarboxylase [Caulochytrium protostelioides]|uniref:Glutamate decarboxylase n=1 Tax=Caulochytrium protostelioides TaxID=1555241 RepID=A0A4P9X094_9FUNG|nr:glutamate decarboxylase [Caulochytrium protostelioides]